MITTIEKQYGDVLALSICFPRRVLSTENSNVEQTLLKKCFGAEQKTAVHSKRGTRPVFGGFFVEQADSTVTVVVRRRRQAGLQGEPCGCNAHKEL